MTDASILTRLTKVRIVLADWASSPLAYDIQGVPILSFDPGEHTGWGLFVDKHLVACGLLSVKAPMPAPHPFGHPDHIPQVYSERPKYYPQSKVPAKALITLALRAGMVAGPYVHAGATCQFWEPWEWKGSLDKNVHHARLWGALDAQEQAVVSKGVEGVAPSLRNNVMDGIGLGLFGLGRTNAAGVGRPLLPLTFRVKK